MRILIVFATLVGCATAPQAPEKKASLLPAPKPSYSDKVQTAGLEHFAAAKCPAADTAWEAQDFHAVVPMANACVKAQEWGKVEKIGQYLSTHAQLTPWGAYYLGLAAASRHDFPRAEWMFELALKKDPNEGLFHFELARLAFEQKNDADTISHMKAAADLNPGLYEADWFMGQLAFSKQDRSGAENYLGKALAANPKHVPSLLTLASLHINNKDWSKAENELTQVIALSPASAKARLSLAQIEEERLNKLPEALAAYRQLKALSHDGKLDETVHVNLDEKIQVLEKSLAQIQKAESATTGRVPSGEKKVSQ